MLFGEWAKAKDEPIPIKTSTFEDFKEFLKFFYLGECNLNPENIDIIVDLAEAYDVKTLKDNCDLYLLSTTLNLDNVIKWFEIAQKFSMEKLSEKVMKFISENTEAVLELDGFLEISKNCLIEIAECEFLSATEEALFDAVGPWRFCFSLWFSFLDTKMGEFQVGVGSKNRRKWAWKCLSRYFAID